MSKKLYIITDGKPDDFYKGNRIIATGEPEQLQAFKKQLLEHGYTDEFIIEEQKHNGWNTVIRLQGYELAEHEGLLYPKRNIDMAYRAAVKQSQDLTCAISSLNELKESMNEDDKLIINSAMSIISNKIEEIKTKRFEVQMI